MKFRVPRAVQVAGPALVRRLQESDSIANEASAPDAHKREPSDFATIALGESPPGKTVAECEAA